MIILSVLNGDVFVWNANDWLELRENHRIMGNLVGCLATLPRQDVLHGLPSILLPEEATLLIEKKLGKLVSYQDVSEDIAKCAKEKFNDYKENNKQEQIAYYEEERKKQITSMIDRIIEGKRRKMISTKNKKDQDFSSSSGDIEIDRDSILKTELEKASSIPITSTLVQTFTADIWTSSAVSSEVEWTFPNSRIEKIRYSTYKDLWEKGYYITSGLKFGGDFLVYPGDPVKFHAQFIVVCLEFHRELTAADIVTYGRLGSSTRKTLVLASIDQDNSSVAYQSLSWFDN